MGTFAAGQVVVLPFPFSDLSRKKLRPALLLADAGRGDWIACQITSNPYADDRAITLAESEFVEGGLKRVSYLRPGKLFTCHESLPVGTVGLLNKTALQQARTAVVQMIQGGQVCELNPNLAPLICFNSFNSFGGENNSSQAYLILFRLDDHKGSNRASN